MLISLFMKGVMLSTDSQSLTKPKLITLQHVEHEKKQKQKHILPIALADPMSQR